MDLIQIWLFGSAVKICWACSMGKCGQTPKDNTCACCRANHGPY